MGRPFSTRTLAYDDLLRPMKRGATKRITVTTPSEFVVFSRVLRRLEAKHLRHYHFNRPTHLNPLLTVLRSPLTQEQIALYGPNRAHHNFAFNGMAIGDHMAIPFDHPRQHKIQVVTAAAHAHGITFDLRVLDNAYILTRAA